MCTDCELAKGNSFSGVVLAPPVEAPVKPMAKTRYSIDVEAEGDIEENAKRLPLLVEVLLQVEGVKVKGFHVNQW